MEKESESSYTKNAMPAQPKKDDSLPEDKPIPLGDGAETIPPSAVEFIEDLDSYQRRLDSEWERAKHAYQERIDQIMDEFIQPESSAPGRSEAPVPPSPAAPTRPENQADTGPRRSAAREFDDLVHHMEGELRRLGDKNRQVEYLTTRPPLEIREAWQSTVRRLRSRAAAVVALTLLIIGTGAGFFAWQRTIDPVVALPYTHAGLPVLTSDRIYVVDWFRHTLYVHSRRRGLPIVSVENLPNSFAAGLALSGKALWSVDGMERTLLQHTLTPDHPVTSSVKLAGDQPSGLYYDGQDFWTAASGTLSRLRGNDPEEVRDEFPLPPVTVTGLQTSLGRVWILDGKSRELLFYRLQKPLRPLASYDLDPVLSGATPTGFAIDGKTLWITTENPVSLRHTPLSTLTRSDNPA